MTEYDYDETIAALYDAMVPLQDGEVEFYAELASEAQSLGLRTLEVTCGTGRVTIPLARTGIRIAGLDISPPMLAKARERSKGLTAVEWLQGDMRAFELGEEFGLVTIPIGSFQLMLTVEDQLAALSCIHRHLVPEGRLAFEVENPNLVSIAEWLTDKRGTLVRNPRRDFIDPQTGRQVRRWDGADYHPTEQRYTSTWLREEIDASGEVVRRAYGRPLTIRYFHRYEMEHLLARAGFVIEAMYGDLRKNEYRATSPDMIWVARRG